MKKFIFMFLGLVTAVSLYGEEDGIRKEVSFAAYHDSGIADMRINVPVYELNRDIAGEFLERFCRTMSEIDTSAPILYIDVADPSERKWFEGDLSDYLYVFGNEITKTRLLEACGAILLSGCKTIVILSDNPHWMNHMPFHKTDDILTIKYGTDYGKKIHMLSGGGYTAALRVMIDGKIDPVSIRREWTGIQSLNDSDAFDWIEPFYKSHGLPAGCGYYDQIDLKKAVLRR